MNKQIESLENSIISYIQDEFDTRIKPLISIQMGQLKIQRIEEVMGTVFLRMMDGKEYSDSEFEELSSKNKKFMEEYIEPFNSDSSSVLYKVNITIEI